MLDITLKKGKLSVTFRNVVDGYYAKIPDIGHACVEAQWNRWKNSPDIVVYLLGRGSKTVGWIIYNKATSAIEEVLLNPGDDKPELRTQAVDALIARESLISAEILENDKEKLDWLVDYGFRPARKIKTCGSSFVKMELSTSVFFQRLKEQRPFRVYRRKEKVVVQKVGNAQAEEDIKAALQALLDKLGGIGKYVKPGQTVVLKPNVVADHGMIGGKYTGGVVTDIRILKGLIELLLPVADRVIVAEGSSINRSATSKMFEIYGYPTLIDIDPKKVSLVDLNTDALVEKPVPAGKRMKSRKIPRTIEEADVIISLPVMKMHFAAGVSLAVKNLQGAMPPIEKYMTHFFGLWQNLVNIHHIVKPDLHIIDGIVAQEDFGPVAGRPKTMNLLIGGENPVTVDAVTMRVMGLEPLTSPPVLMAYLQGLGPVEPEKIQVLGASIDEVASPFKEPILNLDSGQDFKIHATNACIGCRGYLHFGLAKLRRPDPADPGRLLIDRPFESKVNIFLGPDDGADADPKETNIFMGICQLHHAGKGTTLAGCPPHAEVIMNGIFQLFPDVERPRYADDTAEATLEKMLKDVLKALE
ncbi:MAG: DUF362 domain-containing protein [Syntrophobacterales bacterium]|jgi:uncharacterized protein (DUF362 family)|nr:DUF362 domain-containing protein [Syntrophobacterales bacterium]